MAEKALRAAIRVPRRFKDAAMSDLDKQQFKPVFRYIKNYEKQIADGMGLLLSGPPGVGKSHAMAAMIRELQLLYSKKQKYFDYEFITAADLFDKFPLWVKGDSAEEEYDKRRGQTWRKTACTVPYLVINDIAKEFREGKMKEQQTFKLGRILRERNERTLVTHLTTNAEPSEFKQAYGESITSLLSEMCKVYIINGPDRRRDRGE